MGFADATAVHDRGDGTFATAIQPGWDIRGNANGGYLLAILGRAMRNASGRPDPISVTAHYLSPGRPGPVTATTSEVKTGRLLTTMRGSLATDERTLIEAIGTFGDLSAMEGPERIDVAPADLPPPDDCPEVRPAVGEEGFPPSFFDNIDLRLHPDDAGFHQGNPSGELEMRGWLRLRHDEPIDTVALLLVIDALPPTVFNARLPIAWVPTVELTTHVRSRPAPGWLRCEFRTHFVSNGMLEVDGRIWDSNQHIVALGRQLALVPRPT